MTLEDGRNIATIIGVIVALFVYITNSIQQHWQKRIENAMRFISAHQQLFENKFLLENWRAFEKGTFKRDQNNEEMETQFSRLLGEIEHIAVLEKAGAISKTLNIYMFGWWAQRLEPILTTEERNNIYWEVAVQYLGELKGEADDFYKLTQEQRRRYHSAHAI